MPHVQISDNQQGNLCIVIDGSESSKSCWGTILQQAQRIYDTNPRAILYMLSDPNPQIFQNLGTRANNWRERSQHKGSFISPILQKRSPLDRIVVIGSGPIYDLADWENTAFQTSILLISYGESLCSGNRTWTELYAPPNSEIDQRMNDPIDQIIIQGRGFMPIFWNNPGYMFSFDRRTGQALLIADNIQNFGLKLRYLGELSDNSRIIRHSQYVQPVKFDQNNFTMDKIQPDHLTIEETGIFRTFLNNLNTECPLCKNNHIISMRCPRPAHRNYGDLTLGYPVFRSMLERHRELLSRRLFIEFHEDPAGIDYIVHFSPVYCLNRDMVAISDGKTAHRYYLQENRWTEQGSLGLIHRQGEGHYVAYI